MARYEKSLSSFPIIFIRFIMANLLWILMLLIPLGLYSVAPTHAETICAGDIPPLRKVITASGTSPTCSGACRARKLARVTGEIINICAGQPIPDGYVLAGIT